MKVKVGASGDKHGTVVVTDLGQKIEGVCGVHFDHDAGGVPRLSIDLTSAGGQFSGEATFRVRHPITGDLKEVRLIEFSDGSVFQAQAPEL